MLGPQYFDDDSIVDGVIHELNSSGALVWDWSALDHFGYDEVTFPQRFGLYPSEPHGGEVDVFHLNSLALAGDGSGDYIVSARHLDAIFRVDRATDDIDWILGGDPTVVRPRAAHDRRRSARWAAAPARRPPHRRRADAVRQPGRHARAGPRRRLPDQRGRRHGDDAVGDPRAAGTPQPWARERARGRRRVGPDRLGRAASDVPGVRRRPHVC